MSVKESQRILLLLAVLLATVPSIWSFTTTSQKTISASSSRLSVSSSPDKEALQRTASQLERLQRQSPDSSSHSDYDRLYTVYSREPANALKKQLKERHLPTKGRKPDLAKRLVESDLQLQSSTAGNFVIETPEDLESASPADGVIRPVKTFAGLSLSKAAGQALGKAQFHTPSAIQQAVIPALTHGESFILHAETGSGKTLAYLLPITEQLWMEHNEGIFSADDESGAGYGFILTPTRELAAQVAGVATVLAPPGTVRLVSHACNLMTDGLKERGEEDYGGRLDKGDGRTKPRLFVGSAKVIMHSLYGDKKMPASPTTKPEAMAMLQNTRWMVLDEVDRLLNAKKTRNGSSSSRHEKPAAVVTSAVARLTFGRAQVVAASATVGRGLKRELSRVMGLSPQEAPEVIRASNSVLQDDEDDIEKESTGHVGRAVTIPDTVQHYVTAVDTSSVGKLLTSAVFVLKGLRETGTHRRILLVLTRGCGINTQNAVGALKHFGCQPEPLSLLDVLEADGTDRMIQVHRQVTGATGVGESYFRQASDDDDDVTNETDEDDGYLLVTGEDTVRGLHLDGLDVVLVVGRAHGPDEYTHIAGRTGRAGRTGKVINVVSHQHASAVTGWEKMLQVDFQPLEVDDVKDLR